MLKYMRFPCVLQKLAASLMEVKHKTFKMNKKKIQEKSVRRRRQQQMICNNTNVIFYDFFLGVFFCTENCKLKLWIECGQTIPCGGEEQTFPHSDLEFIRFMLQMVKRYKQTVTRLQEETLHLLTFPQLPKVYIICYNPFCNTYPI